jgi:5-methylcytosine-specific restriction endonuclease McrA
MPSLRSVIARHGHRCVYCDATATTVDHVVPRRLAKRGRRPAWLPAINDPANLLPACAECNGAKGGMDVREFLRADPRRLERVAKTMARLNPGAMELMRDV